MRAVAVAAVSMLAATIALVAPTPASAAAAPGAPLVFTTYTQTDNGGNDDTISSIGYDGSARKRLVATSLVVTPGTGISGPEVVGPASTYSPDHTRVAWTQADWTPTTVTYAVKVLTLSTRAVASFPLPSGASADQGGSYLAWTPDGARLVMTLVNDPSTATITSLDLASGTFTPIRTLAEGDQVASIAVSGDGTIAFSSNRGVAVLAGGRTSPNYLYRSVRDESCTTVRARPGTQREFTYLCSKFGSAGVQVIRSQTTSGPVRTIYSGDTALPASPVTFLDGFAWAPSGASVALVTTTVRRVDQPTCTNALTTRLSTVKAGGGRLTTLQTEPTITAQTCRGNGYGDVDTVVWSADGATVVFLHAPRFLGPMSAFAVRPAAPGSQTVLARNVLDLSS